MTPMEKFAALNALDDDVCIVYSEYTKQVFVRMPHVEIGDGAILHSPPCHCGTFDEAINEHWREWVEQLKPDEYLVLHATDRKNRKHFRWNGYMWKELPTHFPEPVTS